MPSSSMIGTPMDEPETPVARNWQRRLLIAVAVGAPLGGVSGYFVGRALARGSLGPLLDWTIADLWAIVLAIALLVSAGYVGWATTSKRRWNEMIEKQPADTALDPAAPVYGRRQMWVLSLASILLLVPPVAAHAGLSDAARMAVFLGLMVLLAGQSWINWQIWRDGDELIRTIITQGGAACFWVLQLGLFLWAALTRLNLAPEVDAWTLITVLMAVYLIVSIVISARRGLVVS